MEHKDHVELLRGGIRERGGIWADLGSGTGAFTLALAELLGPGGQIYSVDRDAGALHRQQEVLRTLFPATSVRYVVADFTRRLDLPLLDGVVMANSLHFQKAKDPVLRLVHSYLKPGGRLILVEYNADEGNPWVPYPMSYATWEATARRNGFVATRMLGFRPSRFLSEIYSAISAKPAGTGDVS